MKKENFERFKNQLLDLIAYSDIDTFTNFCAEHKEEIQQFRQQVRRQALMEQGQPVEDDTDFVP